MKYNKISITINKPVNVVFEFTINPVNTPKWILSIVEEKTDESPVRVGTIYRNKNKDGVWTKYEMIEFERNKAFTIKQKGSSYRVRYIFKSLADNSTELTYFEWVEIGSLENPFDMETMKKLKAVLEN